MQVTTWAAFPILLTHFILCLTLLFPPAISIPATLLFFIAAFFSFYYSSLCCQTDPIDDKLYRYLHPNERAPDQKKSCKSCIYHIPHPLEIKKDRKNSNPTVTRLCQNGNDQGSHGDDASRNDSEMASVSQKKIFVTSPRKLMQRSKQPSPNGEFSNQNETPDKKSSKAGNTLLALTRMSREKKQSESNFKDETQYNFDGTSCNETNDPQQSEEEEDKFCWVCSTQVHMHSMHCKFCDKCVSKFDHHCMWLNTCVGERNYEFFFKTVVSTFFFILIHVLSLLIFFTGYFAGGKDGVIYRNSADWFLVKDKPVMILIINIVILITTVGTLCLVGQLLMFHLSLRRENITTYAYIVRDNARKRDLTKMESEINSRRIMAIGKAKREGKSFEKMILQCGEYKLCESIDPIRKEVLKEYDQERQAAERNNTGPPVLQSTVDEEDDADDIENGIQQQDSTTNRQGNTNGAIQMSDVPSSNESKFSTNSSDVQQSSLSGLAALHLKKYNSTENQAEFQSGNFPFPVTNQSPKTPSNARVDDSQVSRASYGTPLNGSRKVEKSMDRSMKSPSSHAFESKSMNKSQSGVHSVNAGGSRTKERSAVGTPSSSRKRQIQKNTPSQRDETYTDDRLMFPVPSIEFDDTETVDASSIDASLIMSPKPRILPLSTPKKASTPVHSEGNLGHM